MKRAASGITPHPFLGAILLHLLVIHQAFAVVDAMTLRTISGLAGSAGFGYSVANAGDVNGDGYPDIVVGTDISYAGRAYIFYGGPMMDTIPDVTLMNHDSNDFFGMCVAGVGDVNGDGFADVAVGAHVSGPTGLDSGRVYIFFGGAVMDSIADVVMAGVPGELFGSSVAGAGDVNGDGYADVIVGAYASNAGGTSSGRAYIFFGGPTVHNVPDVIFTGTYLEWLGYSVASAGDVNNDGFDDVVVGSPDYVQTSTVRGRAYVYFGGPAMDNIPDVITPTGDRAGTCVAGGGDINGDGYSDILVSDVRYNGRVLVYFGGSPMNNVPDVVLNGEPGSLSSFGYSASSAGDINGDGYGDIIIGAYGYGGGVGTPVGKAYIYRGAVSMDTIPDIVFNGEAAGDRFGLAVAGSGDVNGDGYSDVIVGAYANSGYIGKVYLYLSSDGPLPIQLASFTARPIERQRVRLDWSTLSELNNYGFEVQRKATGQRQFGTLPNSFVSGHGTTNEPHSYAFVDSTVTPDPWAYRLKQIDLDGSIHYSEPVNVTVLSSVEENAGPAEFVLRQNYPNPFNPGTTISYSVAPLPRDFVRGADGQLPSQSHVTLKVYDVLGREVASLVDEVKQPGAYSVQWHAGGVSSGVYLYRLDAGQFSAVRRMLLMK